MSRKFYITLLLIALVTSASPVSSQDRSRTHSIARAAVAVEYAKFVCMDFAAGIVRNFASLLF